MAIIPFGKCLRGQTAGTRSKALVVDPLECFTGSQAKPCQQVNACLDSLRQPLCILADASIAEGWEGAQELSRIVLDTMRQVWPIKLPPAGWVYSQKRMQHFLKVMGAALVMYAQVSSW